MDFAVSCPLVRHGRLLFGFCPSTRTFVPCFLRTPPRGDSPCIITRPSPPSGRPEDFHLQVTEHAQHTTVLAEIASWFQNILIAAIANVRSPSSFSLKCRNFLVEFVGGRGSPQR